MPQEVVGTGFSLEGTHFIFTVGDPSTDFYMTIAIGMPKCNIVHRHFSYNRPDGIDAHAKMIDKYSSGSNKNIKDPSMVTCPLCLNKMKLKTGKFGQFYGCKRFPTCPGSCNLDGTPSAKTKKLMKNFKKKEKKKEIDKEMEPFIERIKGLEIDDD